MDPKTIEENPTEPLKEAAPTLDENDVRENELEEDDEGIEEVIGPQPGGGEESGHS